MRLSIHLFGKLTKYRFGTLKPEERLWGDRWICHCVALFIDPDPSALQDPYIFPGVTQTIFRLTIFVKPDTYIYEHGAHMKEASRFFRALSDESRLKMLWLLLNHRELCVCDFMAVLEITQSKASRHLAALRHAGIADDRKDGLWSYYSLRAVGDELARAHLKLLRTTLSKRPDSRILLSRLREWLKAKNCGENAFKSARQPEKLKPKADSNRASCAGETR